MTHQLPNVPIPGTGSGSDNRNAHPKSESLPNLSRIRAMNRPPSRKALEHLAELSAAHWEEIQVAREIKRWAAMFPFETWQALRRKAVA